MCRHSTKATEAQDVCRANIRGISQYVTCSGSGIQMLASHVDGTTFMLYMSENTSTSPQNYLSQSTLTKLT